MIFFVLISQVNINDHNTNKDTVINVDIFQTNFQINDSGYENRLSYLIENIKPSERGELEEVDLINWYISIDKATYSVVEGFWSDAGTPDSLVQANKLVSQRRKND